MPHGQEFMMVGHRYRGVERGLSTLAERYGERALFVGSPRAGHAGAVPLAAADRRHRLTRFFTHIDETDEQLHVLVNTAIGTRAGVLRPLATTLADLPVGPEP